MQHNKRATRRPSSHDAAAAFAAACHLCMRAAARPAMMHSERAASEAQRLAFHSQQMIMLQSVATCLCLSTHRNQGSVFATHSACQLAWCWWVSLRHGLQLRRANECLDNSGPHMRIVLCAWLHAACVCSADSLRPGARLQRNTACGACAIVQVFCELVWSDLAGCSFAASQPAGMCSWHSNSVPHWLPHAPACPCNACLLAC